MSSTHVPSLPRAMLLPPLDTHMVPDDAEEEMTDATPPGSQWLFRPPPYISSADLRHETVTIHNPAAWRATSLAGYTLSDGAERHTYRFPEGCWVPARSSITLYCSPGKLSSAEVEELPSSVALWKNQDGTLRKKEVLNDGGDAVLLADDRGRQIAMLDLPGVGEVHPDGVADTAYMKLPAVKRTQVLALRTLVLTLCYARLGCIAVAGARVTVNPDVFALFTVLGYSLDILCRWASRQPGVPMDNLGVVLATMGDRLSYLVLLCALVLLDKDARHAQLFAGMLALDMMTSWLQLSVASTSGGGFLSGGVIVRGRGSSPDFATHLMLEHPRALALISVGNEAFLLWAYMVAAAPLPLGLLPLLRMAGCTLAPWLSFLEAPCCGVAAVTAGVSDGFGTNGNMAEEGSELGLPFETEAELEAGMAAVDGGYMNGDLSLAFALAWKVVLIALMVCCAARQLLKFIQAFIALSVLSSGVIADAAGQDMQRKKPTPGRGRSMGRVNGGHSGGGSRARSRSRAR